jgi:hypothetical protein
MKRKINELGDYLYGLLPLPFSKRAKAAPSQPAPITTWPQQSCLVDELHIACKEGNDREVERILQEVSSDNASLDIQCGLHLTTGTCPSNPHSPLAHNDTEMKILIDMFLHLSKRSHLFHAPRFILTMKMSYALHL